MVKVAEYIEREAFVAEQRHRYCENCNRRKGMKNGKMKFVYDIGGVPCRACDIGDMLDSIEDYCPAADVVAVRHGRDISNEANGHLEFKCSLCGCELSAVYGGKNDCGMDGGYFNYCPNCGALMKDGDGDGV